MVTKEQVIEVLKKIEDPEIRMDIWSLGLIYDVKVKNNVVNIIMTLTTPMCPFGPQLIDEVKAKVAELKVKEVNVELTFNPPWEPSDEIKAALGLGI